ncbi:gliding motility-associated C-terminal domain-containing protein, partial [Winogradskyella sp. 3972H.M.0a.05]|uniref:gliding motility-associated C-terminal domain-containing protein n=1 Tax=Winogradskyella sp. 3972H.M.0a.05 TaxID=2950277 RepID=UPI003398DB99
TVECNEVPDAETLTASDNCGDATVTFNESEEAGSCPGESVLTRTWTATDACGNESVHIQTVNVVDTTAPVFNEALPTDATVECDDVPDAVTLTATDSCFEAKIIFEETEQDGSCEGEYVITRTWTAEDLCGNAVSHTQTIVVQDTTAPTFNEALPNDATVECDKLPEVPTLTASDNCDGDTPVTFTETQEEGDCAGEFTITRTWSTEDACGNGTSHTQTIVVQDTTGPTFNEALPEDVVAECDDIPVTAKLTVSDNCSEATLDFTETQEDGTCNGEQIITRTWVATDECGNETIHIQIITVQDTTAPVLVGELEDVTVECDEIPEIPELVFEDSCSDAMTVTFEETSTQTDDTSDYMIIREWTVTDDCGNGNTYTQTITVNLVDTITTTDENLCIGDNFDFDLFDLLSGDFPTDGTWEVVSGNATINGNLFNPFELEVGDYVFSYTVGGACPTTVEATITLDDDCIVLPCGQEDVIISKAVTPNGDNVNDFFTVTGIETCGFTVEVQIFNRWGAEIFSSTNYQNDWDARSSKASIGNSDTVPTGTYYYIVNLRNSGLQPFAGPIYVATK